MIETEVEVKLPGMQLGVRHVKTGTRFRVSRKIDREGMNLFWPSEANDGDCVLLSEKTIMIHGQQCEIVRDLKYNWVDELCIWVKDYDPID